MKQFLKRLMLSVVTLAMFCCVTPLAFADNPNYYTIYLERQGGIGTPEYVFVYRIKTSDGTEIYRTSRLPTPTMEGYLFDGWYTDLVGGDKIKPAEYEFQEDGQTLYAHWTPVSREHLPAGGPPGRDPDRRNDGPGRDTGCDARLSRPALLKHKNESNV